MHSKDFQLRPVAGEEVATTFLELAGQLPMAASQYGLLLATLLDGNANHGQTSGSEHPHYRWAPTPTLGVDGAPSSDTIYVTVSGLAAYFHAHCEPVVQGTFSDTTAAGEASKSSPKDLVSREHFQNVQSAVLEILRHRSAEQTSQGTQEPAMQLFFAINNIWKPVLASVANLTEGNNGVKFVISEKDLLAQEPALQVQCQQLELEYGLTSGPMIESDVKQMIELNGVKYSDEYGLFLIKRSVCFRDKTGEMVAWAGTHQDFSVAALHVQSSYRKLGLGKLVLQKIALMHVRLARQILAKGSDPEASARLEIFAHGDCLTHNTPTMIFMKRCGWRPVGEYLWLGLHPKDNLLEESVDRSTHRRSVAKPENLVLEYLTKQNRPYSVTKAECQRVVNSLVEKDLLTTKLYGKQAIYVVRQDTIDAATQEDLVAIDRESARLQNVLSEIKSRNRQLSSELMGLNSALTLDQIKARLDQLTAKNEQSEKTLSLLSAGAQLVTPEEKRRITKELEYHRKIWLERRRLFKDMFATVTENLPGKPSDLMVELDIDTQDPFDININPRDLAMGSTASKANKITAHDKAILDLKVQRDKLKQYNKRLDIIIAKELGIAKTHIAKGDKKRALLALRRKKFQEGLLEKTMLQMSNLDELTFSIEQALMEKQVFEGLAAGNQVLKELHKEMSLADVEKLMDETAEGIAYQNEIDEMLSTRLSVAEEEDIERELDEIAAKETEDLLPSVPQHDSFEQEQELQESEGQTQRQPSKARAKVPRSLNEPMLA
ncbi:Vacuolar protein sorting-associated protein 20 [Dissophora globulifera]|nr:Vacuolar protein sorting-associated protein 20 [Dissophora globulifera]